MSRIGYIYYNGLYAGTLTETDEGFLFQYDEKYLNADDTYPISLTMPKSQAIYSSNVLFPFFDGLIPEGYLLEIAISKWNIKRTDRMGLLLKCCEHAIGAVSVRGDLGD